MNRRCEYENIYRYNNLFIYQCFAYFSLNLIQVSIALFCVNTYTQVATPEESIHFFPDEQEAPKLFNT